MTEPLIVVEGNLRLPTLRALTDPSLNFGFEWSPAHTRPVQSRSEFPLLAARFQTAYVPALGLSDRRSPYRAMSLWGLFAKEDMPRAMLNLTQAPQPADGADGAPAAERIHLSVGRPAVPGASQHRFSKPVATAIAAACAAVIVWLLFGHEPGSQRSAPADELGTRTQPDTVTQSAGPAPANTYGVSQTAEAEPVIVARTSPAAPPAASPLANTAPNAAAFIAPAASRTDSDHVTTRNETANATPHAHTGHVTPRTGASHAATKPRKSGERYIAVAADRGHATRARFAPAPKKRAIAQRTYAVDARIAMHDTEHHAHATSVAMRENRPAMPSTSMDPVSLYAILQHSPTLDSNAHGISNHDANR
ncbi:hypothetical protein AWB78_03473 [Caballeronia calidae]|uniref:Uncharacterized protein n=1 Tax=Caballeronia calidae TaxID=1777139 RepID=A0A158C452_9BURK|nr:hypothetical protein [Caballeronia calidae]SAK77134.1 hypothetical protein AWB78_03473 [Caballeronia calidae]